jgi:hypothetical protein
VEKGEERKGFVGQGGKREATYCTSVSSLMKQHTLALSPARGSPYCSVLIPQGKNCKFCRDCFVFYPCFPAERYNKDPCKLAILSLRDEYSIPSLLVWWKEARRERGMRDGGKKG